VRVVLHENTEMLGIMPINEALAEAERRELDLVEISPNVTPPVCKIMDFGQFRYQQKKVDQQGKKKQKQRVMKEIRIGVRIGEHDLEVKEKQARKFIENKSVVRVVMQFKGREMTHIDLGLDKIKLFALKLDDVTIVDQEPKKQGSQVVMILMPKKQGEVTKKKEEVITEPKK